jgi:peptidoglycan/xylan/chitin deacetylase (PgdA/CDA1 family)
MHNGLARFGLSMLAGSGLVPTLEWAEARHNNRLRILVYHRIGYPAAEDGLLDPSLLSATPEQFDEQVRFLSRRYCLLSITDLLRLIEDGAPLPSMAAMITFDDGYRDFIDVAWPILQRYQAPALMFLPTGFLYPENQLFWWDRLYQAVRRTACKSLELPDGSGRLALDDPARRWQAFQQIKRSICTESNECAMAWLELVMERLDVPIKTDGFVMNWDDARRLHAQGCHLAAHTRTHPILSRLPVEQALEQIRLSQLDIEREIGSALPVVAYPSGHSADCNDELSPLLQQDGFVIAMSSIPGQNVFPGGDLLRLKRIGLSPRLGQAEFRLVLTGAYHAYCTVQAKVFKKD